jgi:hypothetical protein
MQFKLKKTPIAKELSKQSLDIRFVFPFENVLIENRRRHKEEEKVHPYRKCIHFPEDL